MRYRVEPAVVDPEGTVVVEIPVDAGEAVRTVWEVSMSEQLSFAAFLQRHWADNQVSMQARDASPLFFWLLREERRSLSSR